MSSHRVDDSYSAQTPTSSFNTSLNLVVPGTLTRLNHSSVVVHCGFSLNVLKMPLILKKNTTILYSGNSGKYSADSRSRRRSLCAQIGHATAIWSKSVPT
jgi:hypothetical protein